MPESSSAGELPPLNDQELELDGRLRAHVQALAGGIGERNVFRPDSLEAAAVYLESTLVSLGHRVESQRFESLGVPVRNLEVEHPGRSAPGEILVVGAHYDSVPGCPGANDNGTGVASLIELSRLLARRDLPRTVRFVFFVNEEPPFFTTGHMGSLRYARRCRERGERIAAMFSLETMGCFSDEEGSQQYPFRSGSSIHPAGTSSASWATSPHGVWSVTPSRPFDGTPRSRRRGRRFQDGSPGSAGPIIGRSGSRAFPP